MVPDALAEATCTLPCEGVLNKGGQQHAHQQRGLPAPNRLLQLRWGMSAAGRPTASSMPSPAAHLFEQMNRNGGSQRGARRAVIEGGGQCDG